MAGLGLRVSITKQPPGLGRGRRRGPGRLPLAHCPALRSYCPLTVIIPAEAFHAPRVRFENVIKGMRDTRGFPQGARSPLGPECPTPAFRFCASLSKCPFLSSQATCSLWPLLCSCSVTPFWVRPGPLPCCLLGGSFRMRSCICC